MKERLEVAGHTVFDAALASAPPCGSRFTTTLASTTDGAPGSRLERPAPLARLRLSRRSRRRPRRGRRHARRRGLRLPPAGGARPRRGCDLARVALAVAVRARAEATIRARRERSPD